MASQNGISKYLRSCLTYKWISISRLSNIMATLLSHLKSAQGRTTVIGYNFGFETVSVVAFNLGCEIIKLMS